jgi:hypothetical protein
MKDPPWQVTAVTWQDQCGTGLGYLLRFERKLTGKFRTSVKQLVDSADEYYAPIAANLPEKHSHRVKRRKVRTGRELRLDA